VRGARASTEPAQGGKNGPALNDFNKLWAGQTISLVGSSLTVFALPTLALLTLHASAAQIGVLNALEMLPFPVLGIAVGVLADRLPRRTMMVAADLVRFVFLAAVPVAAWAGALSIPLLYAVALATGIGSVFFGITYQAYLPVVVEREQLTAANTKLEFSNAGASMAGSGIAGGLVQLAGAPAALALDAASYIVSVVSLLAIRVAEPRHDAPPLSFNQAGREIAEGVRVVLDTPNLRWIALATSTTNFGSAMVGAVSLVYAYRTLHLSPGLLGIALALAQIGVAGALLAPRIRKAAGLRVTLSGSLIVTALAEAAVLLAQAGVPYVVLCASGLAVSFAAPIYNITQVSYRQALVDISLQGRMNATMRTFVWGTMPAGALTGGWLATALGVPRTILVGAVLSACAAAWLLPVRETRPAH
jgi:MFS family permease